MALVIIYASIYSRLCIMTQYILLSIYSTMVSYHFAGVGVGVAKRHIAVEVHLVVIPDELEDGHVEAAGERHAVLCHAYGAVLNVRTSAQNTTCAF